MDMQTHVRTVREIRRKKLEITATSPIRVCAYVRVSTGHDGQLNSLQSQTEYYELRFADLTQYQFVGIFSDAGISGAKENRPAFQAMLEQAKSGGIDLIYTKSISRFARNTLVLLRTVRELKAIGVGIVFEEQNINTLQAAGEFMLTVLAGIAEEERHSVRTNVQWAIQRKFQRGEVMVDTNRLLGFGKDDSKNLVIIPEEAKIIRRIYKMYLSGQSAYRIAQILNAQKIPGTLKQPWTSNRILRIIANEKYAGSCLMQKSYVNEDGREVKNDGQRAQYWIEKAHKPIISQADWEAAQKLRNTRKPKTYPFTSLLRCAFCGAALIRVVHERRWVSWICGQFMNQGKATCPGSRITDSRLIALIKDHPITEPVIVEEVFDEQQATKRRQKDYRFIPVTANPASQYDNRAENTGGGLLPGIQRQ